MGRGSWRSGCCARVRSQLTAGSWRTKPQRERVMGMAQESMLRIRGQGGWGSFVVHGLGIEKECRWVFQVRRQCHNQRNCDKEYRDSALQREMREPELGCLWVLARPANILKERIRCFEVFGHCKVTREFVRCVLLLAPSQSCDQAGAHVRTLHTGPSQCIII